MKKILYILLLLPFLLKGQTDSTVTFKVKKDSLEVFENPTKSVEFNGGIQKQYLFLGQNIRYPNVAKDNGYQGKVYVKFMVDTLGKVNDPIVLNKGKCHESLEEEAIRVVKLFPNFIPAENNGKKVNSYYTIPVTFSLK